MFAQNFNPASKFRFDCQISSPKFCILTIFGRKFFFRLKFGWVGHIALIPCLDANKTKIFENSKVKRKQIS